MVQLNLSVPPPHTMNALLLFHLIQKISAYSSHCPETSESQCSLEEYDIDVSFVVALCPYPGLKSYGLAISGVFPSSGTRETSEVI